MFVDTSANKIITAMLEHMSSIGLDTKKRRVVDIGANGSDYCSNSCSLIKQLEWTGDLFEPLPKQFGELIKLHAEHNRVRLFQNAIGPTDSVMTLYCHPNDGDGTNTGNFGASLFPIVGSRHSWKVAVCSVKTLCTLVDFSSVTLMSIDVEGYDYQLLIDFFRESSCRPHYIITEDISGWSKQDQVKKHQLLESNHYKRIFESADSLYWRQE